VILVDVFRPAQWHDLFVMVGTGAAALTGLVFVAMSLNVAAITGDASHRYRAIGNLTGLAAVFMLCALVLMGHQHHLSVGAEILVVSTVAGLVFVSGYVQARRMGGSGESLSLFRVLGGSLCYALEMVGAILLIVGYISGLYIAAVAIVANFYFMISGACLLLVVARSRPVEGSPPSE